MFVSWKALLGSLLVSVVVLVIHGKESGAPKDACTTMYAGHDYLPQTTNPPYEIKVSQETYTNMGEQIDVELKVLDDCADPVSFRGFLLQARSLDNDELLGTFEPKDTSLAHVNCGTTSVQSMTHQNKNKKTSVNFTWTTPDPASAGHVQFRATFVQEKAVWWLKVGSPILRSAVTAGELLNESSLVTVSSCPGPTTPDTRPTPVMAKIQKDGDCGSTKGCFSHCKAPDDCEYLATWVPHADYIDFTLKRKIPEGNNVWIGIGFSKDTTMSDDSTVVCVSAVNVTVISGYNEEGEEDMEPLSDKSFGLSATSGSLVDGVFTCSFTRQKSFAVTSTARRRKREEEEEEEEFAADSKHFFDLSTPYVLFFGYGPAGGPADVDEHEEIPVISAGVVDFTSINDYTQVANMDLPVAHGSLMVVAWLLLASIGTILPRYYKPVWGSSTLCKEKVWFQLHRGLMILAFLSCAVGFVLIFVFEMGFTYIDQAGHNNFKKSHSIVGIIVMVLATLNPVLALFRCHPGDKNRVFFDWSHRIIGIAGYGLGMVNLISGLSLRKGKMEPPEFLVYIVYAHIGWYFFVNIILTGYDCIQRRRDDDYGMEMSDISKGPPEPQPKKDSTFKKLILAIHTPLVTALTIVILFFLIRGEGEEEEEYGEES